MPIRRHRADQPWAGAEANDEARRRAGYPRYGAEVLDDSMRFRRETVRALRRFARRRPWRGTTAEQRIKLAELHGDLCRIYGKRTRLRMRVWRLINWECYLPAEDVIVLPRLSVVSYLHEFAHALGRNERGACRWSLNLFRKAFPRSFARCHFEGHLLVADHGRRGQQQ